MTERSVTEGWEAELGRWAVPFVEALGDRRRRPWAPLYLRGLLGPGERKSLQPTAERVAPDDYAQLHHFIGASNWDVAPLERELARTADALLGGPEAVLVIDDTALPKKGEHSVGVAHQYCGCLGKQANCQTLVSLTLAREEIPLPLALRLYLPKEWTDDPARLDRAHVPEALRAFRPKWRIALDELDRVREAGVSFGPVLADAGYGACGAFRAGLAARELTYAVGIPSSLQVYPEHVRERQPRAARTGRPHAPVPSLKARSAAAMIERYGRFHRLTFRHGTKGPLICQFAAVRVRVADGGSTRGARRRPGQLAWLVCERRGSGEEKHYLTNHGPRTSLQTLARTIKARWVCEQAHQQMKEELGLDHYEGRTYLGLHHHALFSMLAMAFLQHLRLKRRPLPRKRAKKNRPAWRSAPTADPARRAPRADRHAVFARSPSLS